ncbi:unnamed protein product [Clonostachys byssicola]|uniref:Uncharacterized protein n=1 Tax=Clonostachys byssicola TaxID=160290 RepID=A0A9N9UEF0_9HYPO|nr:unnamed protein product [Clonostachys byssicola]
MAFELGVVMRDVHAALAGHPYPVIMWGEEALRRLGAPIPPGLDHEIMLVLEPCHMEDAAQRLEESRFKRVNCSFGIHANDRIPMHAAVKRQIAHDFNTFDDWSEHYVCTREHTSMKETIKLALIPTTYAHISTRQHPLDDFDHMFGIYWPKPARLMISFVETVVTGPMNGCWKRLLIMWAGYWLYQGKRLPVTVMNNSDNENARAYFESFIRHMQFYPCQPPVPGMEFQFVGVRVPQYLIN